MGSLLSCVTKMSRSTCSGSAYPVLPDWSLPIPWLTSTHRGFIVSFPTWGRMAASSLNPIPSSQVQVQSQKELSLLTSSESMILELYPGPINEIREIECVNQPGPSHSLHPLIPCQSKGEWKSTSFRSAWVESWGKMSPQMETQNQTRNTPKRLWLLGLLWFQICLAPWKIP